MFTALSMAIGMASASMSRAEIKIVEVPIVAAMAPVDGYDDNDDVQVALYGQLPNGCYTLAETTIEPTPHGFRIHQFAVKHLDAICFQSGSRIPPHLLALVPYQTDVSLGRLKPGTYDIETTDAREQINHRVIRVDEARSPRVDEVPYAAVTQVQAPDLVVEDEAIVITIFGLLGSSCTELNPVIDVDLIDDVYVVKPTVRSKRGVACLPMRPPFMTKVTAGRAKAGYSLVHVRSLNGRALNHIVEALPR